ncbi:MAG: hypothetical protein LQ349_005026 [Xanthoria aureola]|nr:MAG: hypothetical protein LQ349_005026 [Xanthoria aureola]
MQSPEGENMRSAVEHIHVRALHQSFSAEDLYTNFMALLPQLPKLKTVTIVPHAAPLSGHYKTLQDIPGSLLTCIDQLYPRVSAGIQLCGLPSECQKILSDYSCFRDLDLTVDAKWNRERPDDRANFDISCLLRQASLSSLSLRSGAGWQFSSPQHVDSLQKLNLHTLNLYSEEFPNKQNPNHQLLLSSFINFNTLRSLRLQKYWVMRAVLKDLAGTTHNLDKIVIARSRRRDMFCSSFMTDSEYDSMIHFFSTTALENITLRNITQEIAWLTFVGASGSKLRQLSIHVDHNLWLYHGSSHVRFLYDNGVVKHNSRLGVTSDELVKLNMLCPNIVRLGFDLHGVSLTAARRGTLDPLLDFHQLRHLRLVFHPDAEEISHSIQPAPRLRRIAKPHIISLNELALVSGPDLVALFLHLRERKKGYPLETLLYRQGPGKGRKEVTCWWMGAQRIQLSYRSSSIGEAFELREMYEGTKLRSVGTRAVEQIAYNDEIFPGLTSTEIDWCGGV